jgi:Domain of unknown function (DUF6089)
MTLPTRLLFVLLVLNGGITKAQERWEIGGSLGVSGYLGDLNKSDWFSKEPRPAYGALVRYHFTPRISVRISTLHGRLSGRDSHYKDRYLRNFSTESSINEISTQFELNLWPLYNPVNLRDFQPSFTPFLFVGAAVATTKPQPDLAHSIVALPEYVNGIEADVNAQYPNIHGALPFGLGIKYQVRPYLTLAVEAGFRITFTDYLDGISFSANPGKNDRYKFSSITLSYRFKKGITRCLVDY